MNWINVDAELPVNHGKVLVATGDYDGIIIAEFHGDFIESGSAPIEVNRPYKNLNEYVTHWMYLPENPVI